MTRSATPRLRAFAALAILCLAGGLASGRPELVAIGAPFAVALGVGLVFTGDRTVRVHVELDRDRAIEGEEVILKVTLGAVTSAGPVDLVIDAPSGLEVSTSDRSRVVSGNRLSGLRVVPGQTEVVSLILNCRRWGAHRIRWVRLVGRDTVGLFSFFDEIPLDLVVRVFPATGALRALLRPVETQLGFGDLVSRRKGEGIEFADLRPLAPGDDPRQINWRATARRTEVWVNDRHPERNSDVVLLVDTLAEPRRGVEVTLDLAVRAAAGLVAGHLGRHDRVGLVTLGEPVRWLRPGMGDVQRYRILDTLMESRSRRQMYWRGVHGIPLRALPAKALIIGLSPLLDDRVVGILADLRGRGFDLAVVEIPAELYVAAPASREAALARRVWELHREASRIRFLRRGIATVQWDPAESVQKALAEVEAFRRNAMRARA